MLTKEQNDLLTQTGPGTPGGELLRRYWQPVALAEELPPGGAPLPVRVLSEDLVLFRDDQGRSGLLGLHCSHRGADLSYGRLEDGGLRCIYHGWLYDVHGHCLEQPGEPAPSIADFGLRSAESVPAQSAIRNRHSAIKHTAYPCVERAGAIFAYLGSGDPPLVPDYEIFRVPDDHRWSYKYFHECNYLQGMEGNLDPVHPFFLHRFLPGGRLRQTRVPISQGRVTPAFETSEVAPPEVFVEDAPFGVQIYAFYQEGGESTILRTSSFVLPNACAVGGGPVPPGDGYLMSWHVPIDDTHHWRYYLAFRRSAPLDSAHARERASVTTADYRFIRNKSNRYLQDREEQKTETYTGMGPIFVAHDSCVTETAGEIQDRTQEHLGPSDAALAAARRRLFDAIESVQEGRDPPHVARRLEENQWDGMGVMEERLPAGTTWDDYRAQRIASPSGRGRRRPPQAGEDG